MQDTKSKSQAFQPKEAVLSVEEISQYHDKGYKRDLSLPDEFLHFLKKYVAADWTKDLEVSQLHLADKLPV